MESKIHNFLKPIFKPTVKCEAVSDDLYLPENLISSDQQKLNLGFMAYHVTKPPINLDFQLMCSINLMCIKIWPQVHSLKSIGFEIFVSDRASNTNAFIKIANSFDLKENGLLFIRSDCDPNEEKLINDNENFKICQFFRTSLYRTIKSVKTVRICIRQTARCVPVIKRIEIWGQVAVNETDACRKLIQELIDSSNLHAPIKLCDSNNDSITKTTNDDYNKIPEQFLDSITFEIMALPMVLPSGKTIDNTTLMRYNGQEEKWGRSASDPYTGVPFTEKRKPVLNTLLKSQIDKFLLENANQLEFCATPRTVGSVTNRNCSERNDIQTYCPLNTQQTSTVLLSRSIEQSTTTTSTSKPLQLASNIVSKSTSLDAAIQNVLRTVPRFSQKRRLNEIEDKCLQCTKIANKTVHILYKIRLCSHLVCRNCLIDNNLKICKCGVEFKNVDLIKYHQRCLL